jgi:hypothetical protein
VNRRLSPDIWESPLIMTRFRLSSRILTGAKVAAAACLAAGFSYSLGTHEAQAATFGALSGTLTIRAGDNPQQTTPAIVGTKSLGDFDLNSTPGGIFVATASLTIAQVGGSRLQFSAVATSSSNQTAGPGNPPNATAFVNFSQAFTTVAPQWIELTVRVDDADPEVSALVTLNRTGQPTAVFTQGATSGAAITQRGLFPADTFTAQGFISTTAIAQGGHSGVVDGSILIASLADFNNDGVVTGADLPTIKSNFGSTTGLFANGDLDANGRTDGSDFLLWQRQLGTHALATASAAAVPEPATGVAAALSALVAAAYCRIRRSAARRASPSPAR